MYIVSNVPSNIEGHIQPILKQTVKPYALGWGTSVSHIILLTTWFGMLVSVNIDTDDIRV